MIRTRILPPAEWDRLERPQIPPLYPYVNPEDVAVIVVEDRDEIIGCVSVLRATHFESLWIHPCFRGNAGVGRALLRQGTAMARTWGANWAFGDIESEKMRGLVERLGGVKVPADFYALPLMSKEERESWPLPFRSLPPPESQPQPPL